MLNEIKAEIIQLIGNKTFSPNLSLSLVMAISGSLSLANLQNQNTQIAQPQHASIMSISRPNAMQIIIQRR